MKYIYVSVICFCIFIAGILAGEMHDSILRGAAQIESGNDLINTAFTAVLAFSTVLLWLSTAKSASIAAQQTQLAREEFIASHRPLIAIKSVFLAPVQDAQERAIVLFNLHNTGSSLGIVTEIKFLMHCVEPFLETWPDVVHEAALPAHIKAGFDLQIRSTVDPELAAFLLSEERLSFDYGMTSLTFKITVNYEDSMGSRKQTFAFRNYNFSTAEFEKVDQSDFEYQT